MLSFLRLGVQVKQQAVNLLVESFGLSAEEAALMPELVERIGIGKFHSILSMREG